MPSPRHPTTAGPSAVAHPSPAARPATAAACRLRKHADYQRVYAVSRKQFGKQMSYFFRLRPTPEPDAAQPHRADATRLRVGLTIPKALGKAVDRNRIKRRMREAVRRHLSLLRGPVDVVLHPRRSVIDLDFAILEREVASVFRAIQRAVDQQARAVDQQAHSASAAGK